MHIKECSSKALDGSICRLVYWISEREKMRARKEAGEACLTTDPILSTYRFCNVNREDDAVTIWVKQNVRDAYTGMPVELQLVQLTAARIFNHPPTLGLLLPLLTEYDYLHAMEVLRQRKQEKLKILRGAYLMPPHRKGESSVGEYWLSVIKAVAAQEFYGTLLADYAEALLKIKGLGPFLVNQLVTDLRYMPIGIEAADWETFLICGPGTVRGLNRLYVGTAKARLGNTKYYTILALELRDRLSQELPYLSWVFQDPNNVANCLCEFDKYERARENMLLEVPKHIRLRRYR